jgi:hypothetical protein
MIVRGEYSKRHRSPSDRAGRGDADRAKDE